MEGIVQHVFKNFRYRIIFVKGEYYLIDGDRSIRTFIFPFLNWIISHPVYHIQPYMAKELKGSVKPQSNNHGYIMFGGDHPSYWLDYYSLWFIRWRLNIPS